MWQHEVYIAFFMTLWRDVQWRAIQPSNVPFSGVPSNLPLVGIA